VFFFSVIILAFSVFFNLTPQAVRSFSSLPILLSGKRKTGHKDQSKVQKNGLVVTLISSCVVCSPAITVSSFPDMDMETWLKRGGIYPPLFGPKKLDGEEE